MPDAPQTRTQDLPVTTPVRPAHRFDEARLAAYLADHVPELEGALELRQFEGGQSNPTYLLQVDGRRAVLRKKPPGELLKSAHQVDREYRVMHALSRFSGDVRRFQFTEWGLQSWCR